jgi:hypothetical protein
MNVISKIHILIDEHDKTGAAPKPWLGGGKQVIILQNLITKRKQ